MPEYTQADLPMRVTTTLGEDVLILRGFTGREAISEPFHFHLDLVSEERSLDPADLLRTPISLAIDLPEGEPRLIHGLVSEFVRLGRWDDLTRYQARMVPWFWFLSLSQDFRIFQDRTVLQIVAEVFEDLGVDAWESRCIRTYFPRENTVQYRESHLAFISRLLEEEGIFYYFEHDDEGHRMILLDANSTASDARAAENVRITDGPVRSEDTVLRLKESYRPHTGKVTFRDFNPMTTATPVEVSASGEEPEELFHYPGLYKHYDEGDRHSLDYLETHEMRRHLVRGSSLCRGFQAGTRFELEGHFREALNQRYLLIEVQHEGDAGSIRGGEGEASRYRNDFLALPDSVPFRPPRMTEKPTVRGPQTAKVVGPRGSEIHVDEWGRIKVQFHWDRRGSYDENSSCWIRVATPWAGGRWGVVHVPRIGQEVVVDFLEGDPDRPLVVASVYNNLNKPPWDLPDEGMISGVKSSTTPGGSGYNEIALNDKQGSELIRIHGQRNLTATIRNSETRTVGNEQTITVKKDQKITVQEGNRTVTVEEGSIREEAKEGIVVRSGEAGVSLSAEEGVSAVTHDDKTGLFLLKGGVSSLFGEDRSSLMSNTEAVVRATEGEVKISAATEGKVDAGQELELKVGGASVTLKPAEIELKIGGSSVKLGPDGVEISGATITLSGMVRHN